MALDSFQKALIQDVIRINEDLAKRLQLLGELTDDEMDKKAFLLMSKSHAERDIYFKMHLE